MNLAILVFVASLPLHPVKEGIELKIAAVAIEQSQVNPYAQWVNK